MGLHLWDSQLSAIQDGFALMILPIPFIQDVYLVDPSNPAALRRSYNFLNPEHTLPILRALPSYAFPAICLKNFKPNAYLADPSMPPFVHYCFRLRFTMSYSSFLFFIIVNY